MGNKFKIVRDNKADLWLGFYNLNHQGASITSNTIIDDRGVTWDKLFEIPTETRALSIRQPWAWAIVNRFKPVENRDWKYEPSYRGPLLIHASKTFDFDGYAYMDTGMDDLNYLPRPKEFRTGGIVGVCNMVDVVTEMDNCWFTGPIGFQLQHAVPLKFIPYKGQLNFFSVPARTIRELEVSKDPKASHIPFEF